MDCYYSELYIKSIAHRAQRSRSGNAAGANGKLVFDCVEKAKLILDSAILDKSSQGISWLKYAPVRYYHRLIYSSVMLIKVLRDPDWAMLLVNSEILATLQSTVALLYVCAPDDLHLSRRYSILLGMSMLDVSSANGRFSHQADSGPTSVGRRHATSSPKHQSCWRHDSQSGRLSYIRSP
jgi:hypothetical protein